MLKDYYIVRACVLGCSPPLGARSLLAAAVVLARISRRFAAVVPQGAQGGDVGMGRGADS